MLVIGFESVSIARARRSTFLNNAKIRWNFNRIVRGVRKIILCCFNVLFEYIYFFIHSTKNEFTSSLEHLIKAKQYSVACMLIQNIMKSQRQTKCVILPEAFAHVVHKKILRHALTQKEPNFYGISLKSYSPFIDFIRFFRSRYSRCTVIWLESSRMSNVFSKWIEWFNTSSLLNIAGNVQQFYGQIQSSYWGSF